MTKQDELLERAKQEQSSLISAISILRTKSWARGGLSGELADLLQCNAELIRDLLAEVERLQLENNGYAAGFDTQHAEIERLRNALAKTLFEHGDPMTTEEYLAELKSQH